jgi:predicted histidine transporter YuiF (NhaC family)
MSWLEKMEELTIDQLKRKEKIYKKYLIASLIIFSLCFIGLIIIKWDWIGITIPLLVLVINSVRVRKRIREELKKRETAT